MQTNQADATPSGARAITTLRPPTGRDGTRRYLPNVATPELWTQEANKELR